MNTGERIRELRTRSGMTQEQLGEKLGLKKSAIAKYENGRVENLKRETIEKLSQIFGVTPSYLLGIEDNDSNYIQIETPANEVVDNIRILARKSKTLSPKDAEKLNTYLKNSFDIFWND